MIPAYFMVVLILIPLIMGISAGESGGTDEGTTSDHFSLLKASINDDSNWDDHKTTAFAVLALVEGRLDPQLVWLNSNDVQVSLANSTVKNSLSFLDDYISNPDWYKVDAVIDIELFSLIMLAIDSSGANYDFREKVDALKSAQDSSTGSWENSVYETALAALAVAKIESPEDPSVTSAVTYLNSQAKDFYWGTVRDSAVAVLALSATGIDMSAELKELVGKQDTTTGSFGTVEDNAWAIIAISTDLTGGSYFAGEDAQAWLMTPGNDSVSSLGGGLDQLDLALSTLGESVIFGDFEDDSFYGSESPQDTKDVEPGDGNGEVFNGDTIGPPDDGRGDPDALEDPEESSGSSSVPSEPSGFLSGDNLLWTIIAIAVVVVILGIAFWGLIARVEEGRALDGVRRDIVEYVKHNPGEHFAGIMHEFDMSPSSTTYHLKVLEETEQLVSHRDNKYKRYYLAGNTLSVDVQDKNYKELMAVLKNTTTRKIVWYLLDHQGANQKEVSEYLELHPSTVNWHANRLFNAQIIDKSKNGKEISYTVMNEDSVRTVMAIIEEST
jgi:predicted transcriptional regulator